MPAVTGAARTPPGDATAAPALFSACQGTFQGDPRDEAAGLLESLSSPCLWPIFHRVYFWQLFNLEDNVFFELPGKKNTWKLYSWWVLALDNTLCNIYKYLEI